MQLVDHPPTTISSTFTTTELSRLAAYRAAVAAGFFSDWDGSAARTDTQLLAWLPAGGQAEEYPFTREERLGLEHLRERLGAGELADDSPGDEA